MEENVIQISGGTTVDVRVKNMYVEKIIFGNPTKRSCENRKYLASIMDDSAVTGDEIIES